MGCNVRVFMHEDYFDAILELVKKGLKYMDENPDKFMYFDEVREVYVRAIKDLKESTTLEDVLSGKDRTNQIDSRLSWPKI
jgi:hypothetical protein